PGPLPRPVRGQVPCPVRPSRRHVPRASATTRSPRRSRLTGRFRVRRPRVLAEPVRPPVAVRAGRGPVPAAPDLAPVAVVPVQAPVVAPVVVLVAATTAVAAAPEVAAAPRPVV